jgi:FkbM family methyltransferase
MSLEQTYLIEQEKQLVKRHPYANPLFLPTQKISLEQRVTGLQKVINIYEQTYHKQYLPQIQALREQFKDRQRAFVIGNGPSLNQTDLSLLKDEVTFGVNGIFLKAQESGFKPTFYVVEDHLVAEDRQDAINSFTGVIKLFPIYLAYCLNEGEDTIFYNHIPRKSYPHGFDFSTNAEVCTYTGCTVTISCLQLAYYLGFKEIYLIGVDCDYSIPKDVKETNEYNVATLDMKSDDPNHFDPNYFGKGYRWHDPQVDKMRVAYEEAHRVTQANGVTIYNATVGGKLEVFPRVDYYSLFSQEKLYPRVLLIDMTRIGENFATSQMKQSLFSRWPKTNWLQVYSFGHDAFGLYAEGAELSPEGEREALHITPVSSEDALAQCMQFSPAVIYYRPVSDKPHLHRFACNAIEKLGIPFVIHIVDDWPERLRRQAPSLYPEFDRSLRQLFSEAQVCLSISEAMSEAFQERYGVDFLPVANCIEPVEWLAASDQVNKSGDRPFTIRYVGSLAEDMTLASVIDVAQAISQLQPEYSVCLEIYTGQIWLERAAHYFEDFAGVSIHQANFSNSVYRQILASADALLIAYNFDAESIQYVKYSLANKLPECLAAGNPLITYGPPEVATIAYTDKIGCTQILMERDLEQLKTKIRELIDNPEMAKAIAVSARDYAFKYLSADYIQTRFYGCLRRAAQASQDNQFATDTLLLLNQIQPAIVGCFQRQIHAHIDETKLIAELLTGEQPGFDQIMIDVGAHVGSALAPFAKQNWQIYAFEPDPDNRQKLLKKFGERPNVTVNESAVSDRPGNTLSLYGSEESTGISTLAPFRDSHQPKCQVTTTTVAEICNQHQLDHIDFLKIDTEGFDLMVLKGVPWDQVQPDVIECEFEDRKTVPLGYTFDDLAQYLVDKGYTVLVSEWHPVIRYGIKHDWYRLTTYPCKLASPDAWGNLLAFKQPPDFSQIAAIAQNLVKTSSPSPAPMPTPSQSTPNTNGSAISPQPTAIANGKPTGSKNGKRNGHQEQSTPQPVMAKLAPEPMPSPAPEPGVSRRGLSLVKRILRYYRRWPLGVAVLAVACNCLAMVDDIPFRWAFMGGGSALTLLLVGHAATRSDNVIDHAQETAEQAQRLAGRAQQRANTAHKKGNRAINQVQEARQNLRQRLDGVSDIAHQAYNTANSTSELANRANRSAEAASSRANRAEQLAMSSTETANQAIDKAGQATDKANQAIDQADQAIEKSDQATERSNQSAEKANQVVQIIQRSNSSNAGLFQPFSRLLVNEHLETILKFWLPALNLTLDYRAVGYLAHRICLIEDTCSGRLATSIEDMLLRILVARSVKASRLSVLEIGSLFGISLATLYETSRGHFDSLQITGIDPLDSGNQRCDIDVVTQVPVSRSTVEHNLRLLDIPFRDVSLIKGLSSSEEVLRKAGQDQYNLLILDGDRSYEGVKFDFEHYLSAVDLGGYVIFDDYGSEKWPDIKHFVDHEVKANSNLEFIGANWKTAVFQVRGRSLM